MQLMKQATGKNSITYDQKGMLNSATLLGFNAVNETSNRKK